MCAKFGALGQRVTIIAISHPLVESRGQCTVEHGVTVVQSGSDDTASHGLSQVVS